MVDSLVGSVVEAVGKEVGISLLDGGVCAFSADRADASAEACAMSVLQWDKGFSVLGYLPERFGVGACVSDYRGEGVLSEGFEVTKCGV